MSAQFKLDQNSSPNKVKEISDSKKKDSRPNIDNLLKRISQERHKERKTNLIILIIVILGFAIVSFLLTQA